MKKSRSMLFGLAALCVLCLLSGVSQGQGPLDLSIDAHIASQRGRETLVAASDGPYPGALFRYVKLEVPNRGGFWLGGSARGNFGCDLSLFLQGSYLFPNNVDGAILLDPGATPRLLSASVGSNLDWWYIEGFGTYRISGAFSVVLGYRSDHHNFYTDSSEILDLAFAPLAQFYGFPLANNLRLDLNVLSNVPYFGVQWGDANGITLRIIYSPLPTINVESTLSQNNGVIRPQNWLGGKDSLSHGQFLELYAQYSGEVSPSLQLGFFCKGTWLQGSTKTDLSESIVGGTAGYDVSYYSMSWNVGADAKLSFDVSGLLYLW
jgi:hypothetical protein